MLWVLYDQGFWFRVIRTPLGLPIRFYCRKIRNSSFFQKWYSKSSQNCFQFYYFWELQWCSFRLTKFFRSSQCINYALKTSPLNHSFATKWFRASQVILIFLCGCTKSKSVIFASLRQAVTISKLAHMWNFAPFFDLGRFLKIFCGSELYILGI